MHYNDFREPTGQNTLIHVLKKKLIEYDAQTESEF